MTVSVILSTIGRSTLPQVLEDVLPQLEDGDELIVVADGPIAIVDTQGPVKIDLSDPHVKYVQIPKADDYGCTPKDVGMQLARGDVLWFVDDDDRFPEGSVDAIRGAAREHPGRLLIFRMDHGTQGRILGHSIAPANVGAPQMVIPRIPGLPRWQDNEGPSNMPDHTFIAKCAERLGDPVYRDEIICVLERQHYGAML